jgi:hypothetical protein
MKKNLFSKILILGIIILLVGVAVQPSMGKLQPEEKVKFGNIGINGDYKSKMEINSPDGNDYRCIMFCYNHKLTLDWISEIEEFGFEKAWRNKLIELIILLFIPGTLIYFALNDFRAFYLELFLRLRNKDDFLDSLNNYDQINGSGMITYLWLKTTIKRPVDFKPQPDNSWIEESWILDNGEYIPNPEIWGKPSFWYLDLPI